MTNADDVYEEEEYNEYDEFDDDEERGLSGFSVLIIGLVMIGAFISVVWIAYQQGMKRNPENLASTTPYVAAEPEPIKIENAEDGEPVEDREVYDVFDGEEPEPVTVLAEGPEEPVDRGADDPIGEIAAHAEETTQEASEEIESRIASLEEEDAANLDDRAGEATTETPATVATAVSAAAGDVVGSALSGSHVVQVGAFRSNAEAQAYFARMQSKLADQLEGKSFDVERADLGDRGVYHRLRLGPFASADAAKRYCAELKARGQDCLIKGV